MILTVAGEVAFAGAKTRAMVFQTPAAARPDDAAVKVDQHRRLGGMRVMAGRTGRARLADVLLVPLEALVHENAALHVVALVTQHVVRGRVAYARR